MSSSKVFTNATGAPVPDNTNILTAGPRGPALLQDIWLIEKLAHFDREVIPERRMHAKGWGAYGTFTVTHDITRYTRAKLFDAVGKQTPMLESIRIPGVFMPRQFEWQRVSCHLPGRDTISQRAAGASRRGYVFGSVEAGAHPASSTASAGAWRSAC